METIRAVLKPLTTLFAFVVLEYAIFTSAIGQTTEISRENVTFSVCSAHLCETSVCGKPSGNPTPCRCDYSCSFFGDCCADYSSACAHSDEEAAVFRESVKTIDRSHLTCVTPQGASSYWMVSECPRDWEDGEIRSKCEATSSSPLLSPDISSLPVSHNGTLSYKNLFCALCNGIQTGDGLLPWRMEFKCPSAYTRQVIEGSIAIGDLLEAEDCKYSLEPPLPSLTSATRPCSSPNIIISCPPESQPDIADSCSRYVGTTSVGTTLYGNPYCQLCNTGHDSTDGSDIENAVADICHQLEPSTMRPPDRIRPTKRPPIRPLPSNENVTTSNETVDRLLGNLQPLSIIMDFSQDSVLIFQSTNEYREVEKACNHGEVFDPFTGQCLTLSCAEGYELRENSCVRVAPPLNLTCGADDANLVLTLTALITQKATEIHDCLPETLVENITIFIENTLSLPEDSLRDPHIPQPFYNSSCAQFVNDTLSLVYTADTRRISYFELEEIIDRSLLLNDLPHVHPEFALAELTISQKCMTTIGLERCKDNLKTLQNVGSHDVMTLNGTMYVRDNGTGNIYHSYETAFQANYKTKNADSTGSSFEKSIQFQICDQPRLQSCSLITQNASLFLPLGDNINSLNNTVTGEVLGPDEYSLTSDGHVQYCAPDDFQQNGTFTETVGVFTYDEVQQLLSFIGVSISVLSLLFTFTTYCVFSNLRRCVSNKLITALCFVLLLAQLLQMLSGFGTSIPELCLALSATSHFLWTAVFALTTCLAFELDRTLGNRDSISLPTNSPRAVFSYLLFVFTISSTLVGTCLAIHFTVGERLNFSYGSARTCWIVDQTANLVVFGGPLFIFIISNVILFAHTVTGIRQTTKVRKSMMMDTQSTGETLKELRVYLKISTLLGFTWLFGFVASFAGVNALWYVFIVLNSLQGFYIFLAFMANRRVLGMWLALLCCDGQPIGLSRMSRGSSSLPLSVRITRLTSVSSLPRGTEPPKAGERRNTNDKTGGRWRQSGVSQKVGGDWRTSGADPSKKSDDRNAAGSGDRKYSGASDRASPANDRRYSSGDKKMGGDRKYVTANERRYSSGNKNYVMK